MHEQQTLGEDISIFWGVLWPRRRLLAIVFLAGGLLGLLLSFVLPPVYASKITFFVSSSSFQSSSIPSSLKSAASLAGFDIGGMDDQQSQKAVALLKSNEFALKFIKKHKLLPRLFPDEWNAKDKTWQDGAPEGWEIAKIWFKDIFSLANDDENGTYTLQIRWENPDKASQLAKAYIDDADQAMREKTLKKTSESISYFNDKMNSFSYNEIRSAISSLMQDQIQKNMLASLTGSFIFDVIDNPIPVLKPVFPNKILFTVGFALLGLIIVVNYILMSRYFKRGQSEQ